MPAWFSCRRPQTLAVFLLTALPAAASLLFLQKTVYEARSSILIQTETKIEGRRVQELLRSSGLAGQALAAVGGARLFPEAAADKRSGLFQRQLQIEPGGSSGMFILAFRHHEPQLAAEAVNALPGLLGAELEKLERAALAQELVLSRKRLLQAETTLAMFEKNSPPPTAAQEKKQPEEELERLKRLLARGAEKEQVLAGMLETRRRQFAAAAAGQGREIEGDWAAFLDMKLYERELLRKYKEDDPLLASVRQQLEMQRTRLRQHGELTAEKLAGQIAEAAEALGGLQEEREGMQRRINQLAAQTDIRRQSGAENRSSLRLRDEVAELRALLDQQTRRLAAQRQDSLVTILEQAAPPLKPVRQKQPFSILAAACFGLLCSLLHGLLRVWRTAAGRA